MDPAHFDLNDIEHEPTDEQLAALMEQQFQIWAASRNLWWMRRAQPTYRVPNTERRALSTLQRSRFRRVDKRSASTIGLAADTLLAAATQIWNCCAAGDGDG